MSDERARSVDATTPLSHSARAGSSERFPPGALIADRYEIVRVAGSGGMGVVYEALDRELGERIALKTLIAGDESDRGTYDGSGNIRSIGLASNPTRYTYDLANRLSSEVKPWESGSGFTTVTYAYDEVGNYVDTTVQGWGTNADGSRKYFNSSRTPFTVVETTNRLGGASYDASGNVTAMGGNTYTWDATGTMRSATTADGRTLRYLYGPDDERIAIVEPTGGTVAQSGTLRTKALWTVRGLAGQLLRTWMDDSSSGSHVWSWQEDQIFGGTKLLANVSGAYGTRHYTLDHLGSPRLVTSSLGSTSGEGNGFQEFQPFGGGGTSNGGALQFTGHERDAATVGASLPDYMHARYYDAGAARFLSVDPASRSANPRVPASWNRYSYAANSPIVNYDPDGRATQVFIVGGSNPLVDIWGALGHAALLAQQPGRYGSADFGGGLSQGPISPARRNAFISHYLREGRTVRVLSLKLSKESEAGLISFLSKSPNGNAGGNPAYSTTENNCTHAVVRALAAAGVIKNTAELPQLLIPAWLESKLLSGEWPVEIVADVLYDWQALAPVQLPSRVPLDIPGDWLNIVNGVPR